MWRGLGEAREDRAGLASPEDGELSTPPSLGPAGGASAQAPVRCWPSQPCSALSSEPGEGGNWLQQAQ